MGFELFMQLMWDKENLLPGQDRTVQDKQCSSLTLPRCLCTQHQTRSTMNWTLATLGEARARRRESSTKHFQGLRGFNRLKKADGGGEDIALRRRIHAVSVSHLQSDL